MAGSARARALACAASVALAACQGAGGRQADVASLDARTVVDPTELVALVGGLATADRLVSVAAERGYGLERRDRLEGLDLTLLTFRIPAGVDPSDAGGFTNVTLSGPGDFVFDGTVLV